MVSRYYKETNQKRLKRLCRMTTVTMGRIAYLFKREKEYILVFIFLIGLFAGIVGTIQTRGLSIRELCQFSRQVSNETVLQLEAKLESYEDILFQFVANRSLNRLVSDYVKVGDVYAFSQRSEQFSSFFEGYAFNDQSIYDAVFIDENDPQRKALTMGEGFSNRFLQNLRKQQIYLKSLEADGEVVWGEPLKAPNEEKWFLPLGKRVKNLYSGTPLGIIIIFISENKLIQAINECLYNNFYYSVGTFKSGYTMLVDAAGKIILAPQHRHVGEDYRVLFKGLKLIGSVSKDWSRPSTWLATLKRQPILLVEQLIPGTKWYLLLPIPLADRVSGWPWWHLSLLIAGLSFCGLLYYSWFLWGKTKKEDHLTKEALPDQGTVLPPAESIGETIAPPAWLDELTERERIILSYIAQGCNNKEIARRMFVAEQTVKNYVSTIYSKIGVHDRVQASLKAIEAGLLHLKQ